MLRFSTGTVDRLAGRQAAGTGDGFAGIFYKSFIDVYGGATQPTTADAAPTGILLGTFSLNAADPTNIDNGLILDDPEGGTVGKVPAAVWKMMGIARGKMAWARLRTLADDNSVSIVFPRVDWAIGTAGVEAVFSSVDVAIGSPHTITDFSLTFPKQ